MFFEIPHALGVSLTVIAALCFALQFLCVRVGTVRGNVVDAVFVSLLVNVLLLIPAVLIIYGRPPLTPMAIVWFALAGLAGSMIARTLMFKSIEIIGASRTSPVISANVFVASILAVLVFDEALTRMHLVGIVLIVTGVSVISWEAARDADPDQSLRDVGLSLALPLLAALFVGLEPILVTFGLATGAGVLPGVAIKVTAAWIGFTTYAIAARAFTGYAFERRRETLWFLGAGLTSAVGIVFYFAALEAAPVVIVVPLIQTAPLIVVALSAIFLPERLERITFRLVAAATVVVIGASIVGIQ